MDGSRNESPKALGQSADNQCLTTHHFRSHFRFQADHPLPSPYLALLLALRSQMEAQEGWVHDQSHEGLAGLVYVPAPTHLALDKHRLYKTHTQAEERID